MSVVNVFVSSQRAVVLTDSSLYGPDGIPIAFERKAFPVERWNGATTGRGDVWGTALVRELAEHYPSFDTFIAQSGPAIEQLHRQALAKATGAGQTIIEVHAIGWSEREDRAQAFYLHSSHPTLDEEAPPYIWRDHSSEDGCFFTEVSERERWRLHRQAAEPHADFTAETFDPMRHGIPLLDAQRRTPAEAQFGAAAAGRFVVGGEIWLTVVDRQGTRQDVVHDWPDDLDEPIRPAPFDDAALPQIPPSDLPPEWTFARFTQALAGGAIHPETHKLDRSKLAQIEATQPASGLSRQQRRALEAQQRKRKALLRAG